MCCIAQSWNHIGLIPISAIISFFFFGIEELAVALEEPFSILPLQNMTDGMGLSAKEYADWHFEEGSEESHSGKVAGNDTEVDSVSWLAMLRGSIAERKNQPKSMLY